MQLQRKKKPNKTKNCGLPSPRNYPEHFSLEILLHEGKLKVATSAS